MLGGRKGGVGGSFMVLGFSSWRPTEKGKERTAVVPDAERWLAAALRPWREEERRRGRGEMSGRCTGERRIQKRRMALGGRPFIAAAAVHREHGPGRARRAHGERGGGPGRIRPTVLQVVDVEGTSMDTPTLPKAVWKPREGRATVPWCTVACSRARLWPAWSCLCFLAVSSCVQPCPEGRGSSKQWEGSLGCSGEPLK